MNNDSTAVIIPAYNEEAVIVGTLRSLLSDARPGEFEVVVACNGCTDRTPRLARSVHRDIRVIELTEASKTAAINAGLRSVRSSKVVLLDSDIQISTAACRLLIDALDEPGTDAAIGHMEINDHDCSGLVKAFYRVWRNHPYLSNGKFAAAFAVSRNALDRIGDLPAVIADDSYLQRMIPADRVAVVDGVKFTANVPRELPTLIRVRSRVYRGNLQLDRVAPLQSSSGNKAWSGFLFATLKRPSSWPDIPVYLVVAVASKLLALKGTSGWERDGTTRQPVGE